MVNGIYNDIYTHTNTHTVGTENYIQQDICILIITMLIVNMVDVDR